jgi:GAF domain-containing protein
VSDTDAFREEIGHLRRDLHSAEEREAAVHDVLRTIAQSTFDLDVVLQTVVDRAVHLCDAESGNVARLESDVYRVVAFTGFAPEYEHLVREREYYPERGSVIGRAALERGIVHITDVLNDPEYADGPSESWRLSDGSRCSDASRRDPDRCDCCRAQRGSPVPRL